MATPEPITVAGKEMQCSGWLLEVSEPKTEESPLMHSSQLYLFSTRNVFFPTDQDMFLWYPCSCGLQVLLLLCLQGIHPLRLSSLSSSSKRPSHVPLYRPDEQVEHVAVSWQELRLPTQSLWCLC